jgi:peroxiredoxin
MSWLMIGLAGRWLSGQQPGRQPPARGAAGIYRSLEEATGNSSQPVVLVFFSLACYVCWDELFEMKEFIEKFSLPVLLVGVSTDESEELKAFAARYSFQYPIVRDEEKKLYRQYQVRLEPYRLILVKNQAVYRDDDLLDYSLRREKARNFLLRLTSP